MSITKDNSIVFPYRDKGRNWRIDLFGNDPAWNTDNFGLYQVTRQRTGTNKPHWRDIIRAGGNATTAMTAVMESADYTRTKSTTDFSIWKDPGNPSALYRRENTGDTFLRNNQNSAILGTSIYSSKFSTSFVDNLARASFYKKLRAIDTQFEGYIFAGELAETLHMLRNPLVGIRSLSKGFLDTLGKRKRANPKKWLNDIGSAWLEQSFGWNPLLNDVKDAVKAYERLVKPVKTFKVSSGSKKWYDATKLNDSKHWPGFVAQYDQGNYYHTVSSSIIERHSVRYKGAIVNNTNAPHWQNQDLFGFEPQNFVPAAWELLPWSFLADYFTNIGDILTSSIVSTRNVAWVNKTVIIEVQKDGVFNAVAGPGPGAGWINQVVSGRGSHRFTHKSVSRSSDVGLSLPTLQINFDLTGGQLANIDALLAQAGALHPQHNPRNWHR